MKWHVSFDPSTIAAIAFDLDNTLYCRDTAVHSWIRKALAPDDALIEEAIAYDNSGFLGRGEFYGWIAERVEWAANAHEVEQRIQKEIFEFVYADDRINQAIHELAERFPLGLLTNGEGWFQRKKFHQIGIAEKFRTDCVFATGEIGVHKPEAEAFLPMIKAFDLKPEQILFVGDNPVNDIVGAQESGMRTCWIQLKAEHQCPVAPDWTVQSVTELPGLLLAMP